jgi:hypothetical protein
VVVCLQAFRGLAQEPQTFLRAVEEVA